MGMRQASFVAAAVIGVASVAFAQTKPTESTPTQVVVSPYWNAGGFQPQTEAVPGEQLLTQTVMAVPQARADAVVAKWTYRRLDRQLNVVSNGMRRDFRESDEYGEAINSFSAAYAELESARARATRNLADSPEYQAALSLRKNLSSQIADEHDEKRPDAAKLQALANLKLDYISPIRAVEIDTWSTDPAVREAKAKLMAAGRAIAKLEREFAKDVRDSIELAEIRKSREDARINMLASSAFLDEMRIARSIAVNFALVGQGYDPNYNRNDFRRGYTSGYYAGGFYNQGYRSRGVAGSFGGYSGPVGVIGNSSFGTGSNAFFGRSGNAFIGPGPGRAQ